MNAYSLPKGTISRVLVASGMTRHDCLLQRFIANDIKCINLLVKNLTWQIGAKNQIEFFKRQNDCFTFVKNRHHYYNIFN